MAYVDTLLASYKNANAGVEADAATKLAIGALATQVSLGKMTEAQALTQTLAFNNDTTAVAIATYQFFTGAAPSEAGLAFLLNNAASTNDLNDATGVYGSFNQESRFINFSINLALGSSSAASFASTYGAVSYEQTVATAYNKIIGNDVATAAGYDVAGAVAWLSRAANITALTQFVIANNPTFTAAQVDLAVKAALIGEILNIAVSNSLGGYAEAVNAAVKDLADDGHYVANAAGGVDLFAAYPAGPTPGEAKNLTIGIDTIPGTAGSDTYTGLIDHTTPANTTFNPLDSVSGGAGEDSLIVNSVGALVTNDLSGVTLNSIETVSVRGTDGVTLNSTSWSGVTSLKVTQAGNDVDLTAGSSTAVSVAGVTGGGVLVTGGSAVTVTDNTANENITSTGATGVVTITDANQGTGVINVNKGTDVSVTAAKVSTGTITIGNTTAPTGVVNVSSTGVAYDSAGSSTLGTINVKGGTTVTVTQVATSSTADAAESVNIGSEITQSAVNVIGTSATTSVTVNQSAPVDAVDAVAAVAEVKGVDTVTFTTLANNGTVTVNGLSFTNTSGATLTAAQVASAFANLASGTTHGSAAASLGTYSGSFSTVAGSTGAAASGVVTFTQKTGAPGSISATGATVAAVTGGVTVVDAVEGVAGVIGGAVAIDGTAPTTDVLATVNLSGYGAGSTVQSDALTTLNLSHSVGDVTVTNTLAKTLALGLNDIDGATNIGGTYTTLNVTVTGDSASAVTAGGVKALAIGGAASVDLSGSTLGALETVTVTGSAGVTLNASGSTVKSVDASATSGDTVFTIDGSKATFKGGAGVDDVTLSSTTISKAVTLGAGDDVLHLASGTTSSSVTLSGGDGVDTLAMTAADAAALSTTDAFEAKIDGFEKLSLGAQSGTPVSVDMANLDDISYVISANAATSVAAATALVVVTTDGVAATSDETADVTFSALAAGQSYTVAGRTVTASGAATAAQVATAFSTGTSAGNLTVSGALTAWTAGAAAADHVVFTSTTAQTNVTNITTSSSAASGGLTLTHFANAGTLELTAAGAGVTVTMNDATGTSDSFNLVLKNAATATTDFGTVGVSGVETVNITATDTKSSINTFKAGLTDSALKTLNVSGHGAFELTSTNASLTTINGSALEGALTATVSAANATITGGAGADVLTATGNGSTLIGGAGGDTLIAKGDLNVLTGGAGADIFDVSDATTNSNSYATITDLAAGDFIKFANAGTESFTSAKLALGDTAVFQDFANQAISATDTGAITWFQYGGNTYVVENVSDSSSFVNGTDIIVKITGTNVDLSTATLNTTSNTLLIH